MKRLAIDFSAGIIITGILLAIMNFLTLDLRIITLLAMLFLVAYSYAMIGGRTKWIFAVLLLSTPISLAFQFAILPELPSLWSAIILFFVSGFLGVLLHNNKKWLAVLLLLGVFSFFVVPKLIEKDLSRSVYEEAPEAVFYSITEDKKVSFKDFSGKILIVDFYGTWCKPCIQEIEEVTKVRERIGAKKDIEFLLVCTAFGKDTPEKAKKFLSNRNWDFKPYFDNANLAHGSFGFTGVPALAVIDNDGKVRFKHEGYNSAENLEHKLIEVINSISKGKN